MSTPAFATPAYERTYHCRICQDDPFGWVLMWCPGEGELRVEQPVKANGLPRRLCARPRLHGPHTYADRCECVDTNPVIQQHRLRRLEEAQRRQAAKSKVKP